MRIRGIYSLLICFIVMTTQAQERKAVNNATSFERSANVRGEVSTPQADYTIEAFGVETIQTIDERIIKRLHFKGARANGDTGIPYFAKTFPLTDQSSGVRARLDRFKIVDLSKEEAAILQGKDVSSTFEVSTYIQSAAGESVAVVTVIPIRKLGSTYQRLESFDIVFERTGSAQRSTRSGRSWVQQSVLNTGTWTKLSTGADAVYKVGSDMDVVPLGTSSDQIRLFGIKAGMLSMQNQDQRPDDLVQLPILMMDGGDGTFDKGDYFLFYGEDQITWKRDQDGHYIHELNVFEDSAFYFVNVTGVGAQPKRIETLNLSASSNYTTSTYDYVALHEEELTNLIISGRTWYGESLGSVNERDFGFSIPSVDRSQEIWVRSAWAARSIGLRGVNFRMSLLGQSNISDEDEVNPVADFYGALYADNGILTMAGLPASSEVVVKMTLENAANPQAQGWVDFIELNARRGLSYNGSSFTFRDANVPESGVVEFQISSSVALNVWRVDDVAGSYVLNPQGGVVNGFRFKDNANPNAEYLVFSEADYRTPRVIGTIENQNLHALSGIEYLIIAHPLFKAEADRLAELHASGSDPLITHVVTPQEIYNEFSGGAQDVSAIKEFVRKLYFEADSLGLPGLRYLLLFGDASYDYKNRIVGNSNFVPTHQMKSSLSPTGSIASDDFYGLLDDDEGEDPKDFLDIGIGRLPARNRKEAEDMVNKIIRYANRGTSLGQWRNKVAFIADDADPGDKHTFMRDFETIGALIDATSPKVVVDKVYMDAFKQQAGSGGERYPEGAEALDETVRNGALMTYFIGHGGELGWAHERILDVPTINKWDNLDNLPLFITATCEFARFDDPRRTSGGEYVLLNPSGGGIALLTTTRAVYASPNLTLTTAFTTEAFDRPEGDIPRLGDLMLQTKIRTLDTNSSAALNSRSFALLGDPALKLAYPEWNVRITDMPDTIKALDKIKITGELVDQDGALLESFNGIVNPNVYDKLSELRTLDNDGSGPYDYTQWKNLIFKGKATVTNGKFSFEFVVPKDIDRRMGIGRISLYAEDGRNDGSGDFRLFQVGGLSDNPIIDEEGPEVGLYMNDVDFVFGGITNENPDLYAELRDDNGINMVGSGIGHDITAVLDNNTANTIVLNDYYESDVDSYQSGKVRYPFNDLDEGKHTLSMKVWDVNNNPSDAYLEFVVANDEDLALEHVLNYPNPFTTNTDFYFEHNKPGQNLDVRIEVFTIAGKLVKTLDGQFLSDGFRVGPINWNGRDDYGDVLARGVYMYRVSVRTPIGESVEKFERLVLLR